MAREPLMLRMKLDGETYEVNPDKLTLGESALLKRRFGLGDLTNFSIFDPEQMIGVFFIAVRRAHPSMGEEEILGKVEAIEAGPIVEGLAKQIEKALEKALEKAEREQAADPPAAGAAKAPAAKRGSRATTRKTAGSRT